MPKLSPTAERGIGLIEVLIAVLVLSVGLLGMAALQDRALGNNSSAMAQSMAVVASYTILDALRADRANAIKGVYNGTVTAGTNGTTSNCPSSNSSLAQVQLAQWCAQLAQNLGNASTTTGTITCPPSNAGANVCQVTITFADNSATGMNTQSITTQTGL